MKTADRLRAVDTSAEDWRQEVPEFPILDVTLMRLIRVASQGITALIDPVLRPAGLTESSYHTLIVVLAGANRGTTPSALCEQVGQTRANMTRILDLLRGEALIEVDRDVRDARRRIVIATAAGRRLVRDYAKQCQPILKTTFSSLSSADRRSLERMLRALIGSMGAAERLVERTG